ncbi:unnamed protein product [Enterobius vermicularis]|uniref:CHK domain-containing protein n=1 Tax=Enterobius vermicularis TaxID=51028 RepID=A0A0N4VD58_ENTVE|nr:unnamed protein product [Enterobius vermicularis]
MEMENEKIEVEDSEKQTKLQVLPDTSVPVEYVEKKMQEYFKTSSRFGPNLKMLHIGVGQGYFSVVARVFPDWTPPDSKLDKSFIVKVSSLATSRKVMEDEEVVKATEAASLNKEEFLGRMDKIRIQGHNTEVSFYSLVKKYKIGVKLPEIYFAQKVSLESDYGGLMLMEDAGEASFVIPQYEKTKLTDVKQFLDDFVKGIPDRDDPKLVHPGCIVEDIIRYVSSALSVTDRRQHFDQLLQYYYEELEKSFGDCLSFTCDQLKQAAVRMIPFATVHILFAFGKITEAEVRRKHPDREKELIKYIRENALGLLEDIWQCYQINSKK